MIRDNENESMTASEWRVRKPQRHPEAPTMREFNLVPLLCIASAMVVGLVVGFCLGRTW